MHEPTNLRERNRQSTWCSIHDAAAELVLEDGLAAATVDAIVERAGCSRRTFFNYFPTKEDAILGIREPRFDADGVRAMAAEEAAKERDGATFDRTMRVLIRLIDDSFLFGPYQDRRRRLIETEPALKERFVTNVSAVETLVLALLTERADRGEELVSVAPWATPEQAKALLMLAGTIVRFAVVSDPAGMLQDRDATLRRATATFREVIEHTR